MAMALLHCALFVVLMGISGRAYQRQSLWIRFIPYALLSMGKGRSFVLQLLMYAPLLVSCLLACHWLDVMGWHGLAASGIGFAMLLGLQALRMLEEKQKSYLKREMNAR